MKRRRRRAAAEEARRRRHHEAVRQMEEANQALTAWLERLEHATERRNAHGAPPAAAGEAAPSPRAVVRTQVRTAAVDAVAAAAAAARRSSRGGSSASRRSARRRGMRRRRRRRARGKGAEARGARRARGGDQWRGRGRRRGSRADEAGGVRGGGGARGGGPVARPPQPSPAGIVMNWAAWPGEAVEPLENNDLSVDRALVDLTDTAGLNGAARKSGEEKQKEARKAELEAALQAARDEGNGGDIDDPRVAQMKWLQESGGS